jgi:hypothetical protein
MDRFAAHSGHKQFFVVTLLGPAGLCGAFFMTGEVPIASAIPSFFEIKESGGVRTLSEKNLIVIF